MDQSVLIVGKKGQENNRLNVRKKGTEVLFYVYYYSRIRLLIKKIFLYAHMKNLSKI